MALEAISSSAMSLSRLIFQAAMAGALSLGLAVARAGDGGASTVYKWIGPHGVIHYSDHPHPNAIKLTIKGAQTYAPPPPPPNDLNAPSPPPAAARPAHTYSSCEIAYPHQRQMLMNVYHTTAVVRTHPALFPGNRIELYFDGRRMPGRGPAFSFPVNRGQHTVSAVILSRFGQIVCETSTVTFYVHQPSIQNPHNPVHPF